MPIPTLDHKKQALYDRFAQHITPERRAIMLRAIQERTLHITVVLEDIYRSHTMSAVLRSADCFGIQDIHIIEQEQTFSVSKDIAKGASQWLTLNRYSARDGKDTQRCFTDLRNRRYTIVAATPLGSRIRAELHELTSE